MIQLNVNNLKVVLSSTSNVLKTGRFLSETRFFSNFDAYLSSVAASLLSYNIIQKAKTEFGGATSFSVVMAQEQSHFIIKNQDIIFVSHASPDTFVRMGDQRFANLLKQNDFNITLTPLTESSVPNTDLLKVYRLNEVGVVNFPLLDSTQSSIITTQDENMLVQGVAGSGKTNLCIDKVVHSATQNYAGRILYSTFSRGLLIDTKGRIAEFSRQVKQLVVALTAQNVVFLDDNKVGAIEKKLGITLYGGQEKIIESLTAIAEYLDHKVDYVLIEDLYKTHTGKQPNLAGESYFTKTYTKDIKNHQLASRLQKIKTLSHEVIYKEIFGLIAGSCNPANPTHSLTQKEYTALRSGSFSTQECETIYAVAKDYFAHLDKSGLTDNNFISRHLLAQADKLPIYSLTVLDEVQDFTEVNLVLFKHISRKMFCVGDALQMINASYFSFGFIKRLLYEKDISSTAELVSNYRNTKKIADISENLGKLNAQCFGVHSFVLRAKAMDTYSQSDAVYVAGGNFLEKLNAQTFNNYTVVVASVEEKERLRKTLHRPEILTVSEIKGLERETVVLSDVLSSNINRWKAFERANINRKTADENSVYRYYFNLLYVGVSRAKHKLYIVESEAPQLFGTFFKENFKRLSDAEAVKNILLDADKLEAEQDDIIARVRQFIALEQYDNARFAARSILVKEEQDAFMARVDVAEQYIARGLYKEAGIKYLQYALYQDAQAQFALAENEPLQKLAESCQGGAGAGLEVLPFFTELSDNQDVRKIIVDLVQEDLQSIKHTSQVLSAGLKRIAKT